MRNRCYLNLNLKFSISLLFTILFACNSFGQNFNEIQIDSVLKIIEQLPKEEYSYGLTLSLKSYDDSKKINYKKGMMESLLTASKKQYELGKYEDAIKNAEESEKIAFEISDIKVASDAVRLKGISFVRLRNHKSGRKNLQIALSLAEKLTDKETKSSRIGVIYNDIALNIDQSNGSMDSVAYFYRRGYKEFEKMVLSKYLKNKTLSLACSNVGSSFLRAKELDSAEFYLDRALQLANSVNHNVVIATTLGDLGSLFFLRKNYELSIDYFKKAIVVAKQNDNPYILKSLYLGISKSYSQVKDDISSTEYLEAYVSLSDSINTTGNLTTEEKALLKKEKHSTEFNDGNRSVVFYSLFFIISAGGMYLGYSKRKKTIKSIEQITVYDDEIVIIDEKHLKRLVYLASTDDPSFLGLFKETYPDFYKKLNAINPGLIAGEQKMCAFLKLDFTAKEIASYTNSSIRAVEGKKYRLRKKLSIPSEEDINVWMMNV